MTDWWSVDVWTARGGVRLVAVPTDRFVSPALGGAVLVVAQAPLAAQGLRWWGAGGLNSVVLSEDVDPLL